MYGPESAVVLSADDAADVGKRAEFLSRLGAIWMRYPDLRFGQFLSCVAPDRGELFLASDEHLLELAKRFP